MKGIFSLQSYDMLLQYIQSIFKEAGVTVVEENNWVEVQELLVDLEETEEEDKR